MAPKTKYASMTPVEFAEILRNSSARGLRDIDKALEKEWSVLEAYKDKVVDSDMQLETMNKHQNAASKLQGLIKQREGLIKQRLEELDEEDDPPPDHSSAAAAAASSSSKRVRKTLATPSFDKEKFNTFVSVRKILTELYTHIVSSYVEGCYKLFIDIHYVEEGMSPRRHELGEDGKPLDAGWIERNVTPRQVWRVEHIAKGFQELLESQAVISEGVKSLNEIFGKTSGSESVIAWNSNLPPLANIASGNFNWIQKNCFALDTLRDNLIVKEFEFIKEYLGRPGMANTSVSIDIALELVHIKELENTLSFHDVKTAVDSRGVSDNMDKKRWNIFNPYEYFSNVLEVSGPSLYRVVKAPTTLSDYRILFPLCRRSGSSLTRVELDLEFYNIYREMLLAKTSKDSKKWENTRGDLIETYLKNNAEFYGIPFEEFKQLIGGQWILGSLSELRCRLADLAVQHSHIMRGESGGYSMLQYRYYFGSKVDKFLSRCPQGMDACPIVPMPYYSESSNTVPVAFESGKNYLREFLNANTNGVTDSNREAFMVALKWFISTDSRCIGVDRLLYSSANHSAVPFMQRANVYLIEVEAAIMKCEIEDALDEMIESTTPPAKRMRTLDKHDLRDLMNARDHFRKYLGVSEVGKYSLYEGLDLDNPGAPYDAIEKKVLGRAPWEARSGSSRSSDRSGSSSSSDRSGSSSSSDRSGSSSSSDNDEFGDELLDMFTDLGSSLALLRSYYR